MKRLLAITILLFSVPSFAGFFAEPFVGYESTTTTAKTTAGQDSSSKSTGFGYAARLGYRFAQKIWVAAEYAGGSGKDDTSSSDEYTNSSIGAVVGYDFGKYNLWAGYGFTDTTKVKSVIEMEVIGTNFKLGGGYKAAEHVSLNLDVVVRTYTKAKIGGSDELDLSSAFSEFKATTILLSVSFPFGHIK